MKAKESRPSHIKWGLDVHGSTVFIYAYIPKDELGTGKKAIRRIMRGIVKALARLEGPENREDSK